MKEEVSKCFSFSTRKSSNKDFPVDLLLNQRGKPLVAIPCVGEYACGKVVESLAAACAAYKEAGADEPRKAAVPKVRKKSAKVR